MKERIGNYLVEVIEDTYPENPRTSFDNVGTMVCFHKRYNLGDKHKVDFNDYNGWEDMCENLKREYDIHTILPIYMYDHSGITISTKPFGCRWDSGQLGWIFVSHEDVKKEGLNDQDIEKFLIGEVEIYDQYLRGDVWGYRISKVTVCSEGHEHLEEVDSCWGFFGEEFCKNEAISVVNNIE